MRILHVISGIDLKQGGTAKTAIDLTCAQAAQGLDVSLLSTFRQDDQVDGVSTQIRDACVKLKLIGPSHGKFNRHPDLRRSVTEAVSAADVVHIHALWEDAQHYAAAAAKSASVPYVWLPQGMLDPWSLSQSRWQKQLVLLWRTRRELNNASALHFTTEVERDVVARLGLKPPAIIESLGIDLSEFDSLPPRGSFVAKYPQLLGKRITLFLSRVHLKKGLDLLVPAFAKIAGIADVLVIAGPIADGYEQKLDALIERTGTGDRVLVTGMLYEKDRLAAMIDAAMFVLPSYQENFGIAVAEALAAGCPVIISDQVNIWKELKAADAAGVVPTQVEPLAAMMLLWLADADLRRGYAERGRAFARSRYDWRPIAERWKDHYARLSSARRDPWHTRNRS